MSKTALAVAAVALLLAATSLYQTMVYQSSLDSLRSSIASALQNTGSTVTVTTTVVHETSYTVIGQQVSYSDLYEKVKNSVVLIRVIKPFGVGVGSGFVYDQAGHIVTNNHVVEDATSITVVFLDRSSFDAELVGRDVDSDLAVVKIDPGDRRLEPLRLGDSDKLRIGDLVAAIGNPLGLEGTITIGVVSQKGRLLSTARGFSIPGVIQTDAAINPGNSGGPLINMAGEVVGVTTAIEPAGVGIGYAVPSSIIRRVVPALIEKGHYERSWLGIAGLSMDDRIARAINIDITRGVLVTSVVNGSPASSSGLRGGSRNVVVDGRTIPVGGDIIVAINGTQVNSLDDFLLYMEENTSPGMKLVLTVYRDGGFVDVPVTLAVRP